MKAMMMKKKMRKKNRNQNVSPQLDTDKEVYQGMEEQVLLLLHGDWL